MAAPIIFKGSNAKLLNSGAIEYKSGRTLHLDITVDLEVAGLAATQGSFAVKTDGTAWTKTGGGDTAWTQLSAGGSASPPPIDFQLHGIFFNPLERFGGGWVIDEAVTFSEIRVHAFESGASGTTTVRIHKSDGSGGSADSEDVTLTGNGGENKNSNSTLTMTGIAGDVFFAELLAVSVGGIEDLTVSCFF